jgi:ABC-type branched-subunit amino acid transport system permease subunit
MKYVAPVSLAIIALFQAFASWGVIQMVQYQSEHYEKMIIDPTLLYVILSLGILFVIGCTGLEIFGKKEDRSRRFLGLGVIGFAVYSIPASIILFYTVKPWLRQILYI